MADLSTLTPNSAQIYRRIEDDIRNKYVDIVNNLPYDALIKFNKYRYSKYVKEDILKIKPDAEISLVERSAHYISNALNNEAQKIKGSKKSKKSKKAPLLSSSDKITVDSGDECRSNICENITKLAKFMMTV